MEHVASSEQAIQPADLIRAPSASAGSPDPGMPAQTTERGTDVAPAPVYSQEWDYTEHARYYYARPNYSSKAIDKLVDYVAIAQPPRAVVVDVGAGTGNLSLLLAERGFQPIAVEPNFAMMRIGLSRTATRNVYWKIGTSEHTGMKADSVDWITYGSSFGTSDRDATLREVQRVMKRGGYFTCMWNHRDLVNDPVQSRVEHIIKKHYPNYTHGLRREDQGPILDRSGLFSEIHFIEDSFTVTMGLSQYKDGWRSVKNRFWDLRTAWGRRKLESILKEVEDAIGQPELEIPYTTRIWVARLAG